MKNFIDDEMVEAAVVALNGCRCDRCTRHTRAALEVALPLIVAKLEEDLEKICCDESAAARIRELTGAKP
jgi:hypothetical protein